MKDSELKEEVTKMESKAWQMVKSMAQTAEKLGPEVTGYSTADQVWKFIRDENKKIQRFIDDNLEDDE